MATITFHLFYTNCEECEGCVALQMQGAESNSMKNVKTGSDKRYPFCVH